jgi:hypothetical protein
MSVASSGSSRKKEIRSCEERTGDEWRVSVDGDGDPLPPPPPPPPQHHTTKPITNHIFEFVINKNPPHLSFFSQ